MLSTRLHDKKNALEASDLEDLATFFNLDKDYCLNKVLNYSPVHMAEEWRSKRPQTPKEIWEFYASTELYIWELMQWHANGGYASHMKAIDRIRQEFRPGTHPRVLDYGAGIGTTAIRMAESGYRVAIADVPGKTFEFAKHRFRRRGLSVDSIELPFGEPDPHGCYDVLICFDVLEHVPAPEKILRLLVDRLREGGVAAITVSFATSDVYPHHLPTECARFSGVRWNMMVESYNLNINGDNLHIKGKRRGASLRQLKYQVWEHTGVYPGRSAALDDLYMGTVFREHSRGTSRRTCALLLQGVLNNPAWIGNRGVQVIALEMLLGRHFVGWLKTACRRYTKNRTGRPDP